MKDIITSSLDKSMSYAAYRNLVQKLIKEGKSTGPEQSEVLLNYSVLNDKRMNRLDKTLQLSEETIRTLKNISEPKTWLVLTESWCGDAAQTLPVINKIAEESNKINFKVVLRDENEELMNQFLTNGGKSIPKLIVLDKENNVLNSWGPRPSEATKMVNEYKEKHGALDANFKQQLQVWYNKNKGKNTEKDLIQLL